MQIFLLILLVILCTLAVVLLIIQNLRLSALSRQKDGTDALRQQLLQTAASLEAGRQSDAAHFEQLSSMLRQEQRTASQAQEEKLSMLGKDVSRRLSDMKAASDSAGIRTEERMRTFSAENAQKLEAIRATVQTSLGQMQTEQTKQLDEMRKVVDEKMQKVLSERMQQAFSAVNERLEQVYKGLGEMQGLASNVGDLKKLLTNVKSRGEIGEIQLEGLLTDILSEGQFLRNAKLGKGTVEFAVRLPEQGGGERLLPVDAKFAGDTYLHLQNACDSGDAAEIERCRKLLCTAIRKEAQDIAGKYIEPPLTTDFGILFLPTEGLYAEAARCGLPEEIFRKYRIFVTGPSTAAAMLSALQMGMQSIAVQKYSREVWQVLGEVRTEFGKFADALARTQDKLHSASDELEKLVGVRTRQMERKLSNVQNYLTEQSGSGEENRA